MNNFYIIGTKYGENNDKDIIPYLLDKQVIAIGFCWETDLNDYYSQDSDKLDKILRGIGEKPTAIAQVKRFLSLQPGDMIALKSTGSPIGTIARLEIVGYAVVVERNGVVYKHDPDDFPSGLGHTINVDFLEFGVKRTFQLGYGRSVHKLELKSEIDLVFGSYADIVSSNNNISSSTGVKQKNTSEIPVTISAQYLRKAIHNKIQQGIYEMWVRRVGEENVKMEENFIDIVVTTKEAIELIEIKPYQSATQCIREGFGQLLSYYHKNYSNCKNVSLTIIGSNEPNADDKNFIEFVQAAVKLKFNYDSWERLVTS